MTDVAEPTIAAGPRPRTRPGAVILAGGLLGGLVLGVVARVWMRMITDDPEFSWGGTLFIVIGFGLFGFLQGAAFVLRRCRFRWLGSAGRVLGTVGLVPV